MPGSQQDSSASSWGSATRVLVTLTVPWLGPPEPLGARVFSSIGFALGGLLCALVSLGSLIILGWWIRSIMASLGL